jgi:Sec-independent protein translocase protein TatA
MDIIRGIRFKKFLEEAEKEKKELEESYKQSRKNQKDRTTSEKLQEELEPLPHCPMSDE